jgi:carbonic anhydrase/acetyltransferase-like protein (isoleucine patch superfamily)
MISRYQGTFPQIHATAFIETSAQVIGDVTIGADASVWFNAVVRGDVHVIRIGARTNVQDGAVLHGTSGKYPVVVEDDVTIGHGAVVHGCTVHSACLIGIGAVVLDGAEIGDGCIIGAGTVVTEGLSVPPHSLVLGVPGKVVREVTAAEIQGLKARAARYVAYKNSYLNRAEFPLSWGTYHNERR